MATTTNVLLGGITINEIGYDPSGPSTSFDTDNSGGVSGNDDEFIEIINVSGGSIDLTGVQLWDAGAATNPTFTFGSVTLAAGERFVIIGESANLTSFQAAHPGVQSANALNNGFGLNNNSDEFALIDTSGNYVKVAYVEPSYSKLDVTSATGFPGTTELSSEVWNLPSAADGQTVQRFPDGDTAVFVDTARPGQSNLCFFEGTLIATPTAEKAVEDLRIGDPICTADGRVVPVKWIGKQHVNARRMTKDEKFAPVCIAEGTLGNHTDLYVSADHGMLIDGLVINAAALVNGSTIRFVAPSELAGKFTYYHVETEAHDVIFANGAITETFIDAVGRSAFDNYQEYIDLYGAERLVPEMGRPRISSQRLVPQDIKDRMNGTPPARAAVA